MRFTPTAQQERGISYVRSIVAEAGAQNISLRVADLVGFDEVRLSNVEAAFSEAQALASQLGVDLQLPKTVPTQVRRCDFVEEGSVFVSWDGDVHPCYDGSEAICIHRYVSRHGHYRERNAIESREE